MGPNIILGANFSCGNENQNFFSQSNIGPKIDQISFEMFLHVWDKKHERFLVRFLWDMNIGPKMDPTFVGPKT